MCDQNGEHKPATILLATLVCFAFLLLARVSAWCASHDVPQMAAPPHLIAPHFFGVNIENNYFNPVPSWTDPRLQRAIKEVGIQTVRYPGGDAGNYWDWQKGTLYPRGGSVKTQDSLSNLANLTRATGTYPIYNLNVMTLNNSLIDHASLSSAIESQLQMLKAAQKLNLPVEDLELGNEFFWSSPDYQRVFPTAKDYATTMDAWSSAFKKEYPSARIAAVGSIPYKSDARTKSWNASMIGKIHGVEAVTLHRYDSIIDGGTWDGTSADAVLSYVFSDWSQIESGELSAIEKDKLKVWVTEFGGLKDCTSNAHFTGTWLEALYQTQMAIQFLSSPSVEQIELYNITGSTSSLMFQDTSSYWDACLNKSMPFHAAYGDLTATGQAYSLIGEVLKQAKLVSPVLFSEAPILRPKSGGTPYPSVTGVALTGARNQWIIVNFAAQPLTLKYPGMGTGTIESLHAPSLTTMVTSEHVLAHTTGAFDGRSFVLPPFSVNKIVAK